MAFSIGNITFNRRSIGLALLFLAGLAIFVYPFASNWYYEQQANAKLQAYTEAVASTTAEKQDAYDEAFAKAQAYNEELVGQVVPDVFAIREGTTDKQYESFLNVNGDQMMGSVEIPAIGVRLPIYHYSTAETLDMGAGHIFGSSLPVGGESSHAVITAHRGLPTAKMFSDLDQVVKGDKFYLHVLDRTLAYEVDHIETVEPQETRSLAIEKGEDLCTLVTCTPYGVNTERLLVRGHRVPYVAGDEQAPTDIRPFGFLTKIAVAGAGVLFAALVLWLYLRWRKRKYQALEAAAQSAGAVPEFGTSPSADALDERIARARHRA